MTSSSRRPFWQNERALFALLLAIHLSFTAWLILARRMPRGHDMLGNYFLQYLFASHASAGDGVALWMPYVTHGLVSNWALTVSGGLFQNALLAVGGPPEGTNFLVLFHLGMLLDELVLLSGVWLLGRRFSLAPPVLFFMAAAAAGSTVWADQPYWNHRILFAIPLILALLQGFLEEGTRWKLHAGINLLVLQAMGNVPYIALFTGFVVLLYLALYLVIWRRRVGRSWPVLRPRALDLACVPLHHQALAAVAVTVAQGTGEIVQYRHGRSPDGGVTFDAFLKYGGGMGFLRYLECFFGTSPGLDVSLYVGVPAILLALVAPALRPGRRTLHLGLVAFLILSFSLGFASFFTALTYYGFPLMKYFRYAGITSSVLRIFLILLAGVGLDALLRAPRRARGATRSVAVLGLGIAAGALLLCLAIGTGLAEAGDLHDLLRGLRTWTANFLDMYSPFVMIPVLAGSALAGLGGGILLLRRLKEGRGLSAAFAGLVLLQAADIHRWKFQMLAIKTAAVSQEAWEVQRVGPIPFVRRRSVDYAENDRFLAMAPAFFNRGANYDFMDGALHMDPPTSRFWSHHWLAPVDRLSRACRKKMGASEEAIQASLEDEYRKLFPAYPPPIDKAVGLTEDKLQVFRGAVRTADVEPAFLDPSFRGDVLLLEAPGIAAPAAGRLSGNDRVAVRPEVVSFGANHLDVRVDLPSGLPESWLLYCDAWHPYWKATGNGAPAAVGRAQLAYKAVRLGPGSNEVRFRFEAPLRTASLRLLGFNALGWCAGVVVLILRLLRGSGPA